MNRFGQAPLPLQTRSLALPVTVWQRLEALAEEQDLVGVCEAVALCAMMPEFLGWRLPAKCSQNADTAALQRARQFARANLAPWFSK